VPAHVLLLRGINIGSRNRIAMPKLREALDSAGFDNVRTYLQSGNVVVSSDATPGKVAEDCKAVIAERFGLDIEIVTRTHKELAQVVKRNPLAKVADNPKRYQVSFLAEKPDRATVAKLSELRVDPEEFVHIGRELYAWHPDGVARSKLWNALAGPKLGIPATARNWTTVTQLLEMAEE
jgi:uncharacterized protein (DUF1697 family)